MTIKGYFCSTCKKKKKAFEAVFPDTLLYEISKNQIIWLKNHYQVDDIFAYLMEDPKRFRAVYGVKKEEKLSVKNATLQTIRETGFHGGDYKKNQTEKPQYVTDLFSQYPMLSFVALEGDRKNPKIYFFCKRCHKECCSYYAKFRLNYRHNCDGTKSSGELLVEEFLKEHRIAYKTQRNALYCLNPKTKRQLPYDFELTKQRIIIEVQGQQHTGFVEYFHATQENYDYQLWKDKFKKDFAIAKGYRYLELFYDDIKSGVFKEKILELCRNEQAEEEAFTQMTLPWI